MCLRRIFSGIGSAVQDKSLCLGFAGASTQPSLRCSVFELNAGYANADFVHLELEARLFSTADLSCHSLIEVQRQDLL